MRWTAALALAASLYDVNVSATATVDFAPGELASKPRPAKCETAVDHSRDSLRRYAACQAAIYGLPSVVAHAVMEIESNFNTDARGADGEVGLMQVMPGTARMLGFRGTLDDLSSPETNIALGVKYLAGASYLAHGDLCTTVMKYRAGHGETRFSALSVRYCERARDILKREGVEVTGPLPVATFGFEALAAIASSGGGGGRVKGVCVRRSFVPGPGYMRCAEYRSAGQAQRIRTLRAKLFGG